MNIAEHIKHEQERISDLQSDILDNGWDEETEQRLADLVLQQQEIDQRVQELNKLRLNHKALESRIAAAEQTVEFLQGLADGS